jgi:hypothetical protein
LRAKLRKKEEEKKVKDEAKKLKAAEVGETAGKKSKKPVEEELDPTKYTENRKLHLESLR